MLTSKFDEWRSIVADGRSGANRNYSSKMTRLAEIVADGRSGANLNYGVSVRRTMVL